MFRTAKKSKKNLLACPIARVADIIGDSYVVLIIRDLLGGTKHFGDFEHSLKGISSRTLTKKLQLLEQQSFITRKKISGKPPRVEYSLTKKGKGLHKIIEEVRKYGKKFL
ncbi:MAG: helix-turn-helix transcriptional regulator [Candidatus Buchananbacteria bacterium]|nr:helix-turn-helix transcriptional regulator [Candidatus Buchananbacteria bacterium]